MKKNTITILLLFFPFFIFCQGNDYKYNTGENKYLGYLAQDENATQQPVSVLILPAWMGVDKHSMEVANKLAALGYRSFVADIYGVENKPKTKEEAAKISGEFKSNPELYVQKIKLAYDEFNKTGPKKNNIVVIGYCFGGTGALEAARTGMNLAGAVSFHGGLKRNDKSGTDSIKAKILVLHGADDPSVSAEDIAAFQKEMKGLNADWQMNIYSGAVHSFTHKNAGSDNSTGSAYNEKADKRSWEAFMDFLKEISESKK